MLAALAVALGAPQPAVGQTPAEPPTLAQRIVRAKNKIKVAGIPYVVPRREQLPERLDTVLRVVYLVFNEGYAASSGSSLTRTAGR